MDEPVAAPSTHPSSLTEDEYLTGPPPKSKNDVLADDDSNGEGDGKAGKDSSFFRNEDDEQQSEENKHYPISGLSLKSTLYADEFIAEVDKHYMRVACSAICVWLTLVSLSYWICNSRDALVKLTGIEQKAPMVASLLLGMSLFTSVLPLLVRENKRCMSGVIVCAVVVQLIAFSTDLLIAFLPTPVLIDPVCGNKSYLLRYCEWTPLAFTMAFLTESCRIDDPSKRSLDGNRTGKLSMIISAMTMSKEMSRKFDPMDPSETHEDLKARVQRRLNSAYYLGLTQGMSTFCAWIFPLCPGIISWTIFMTMSCLLFSVLWNRLWIRSKAFKAMKPGSTLSEHEMYQWTRLSLGLLRTCTFVWSLLVISFFICSVGPAIFPNNEILKITGLSMMLESTLDVVFKAIYLLIVIDVHDTIFDPSARAERRLEELRQMLSVVWDNSSDVIGISVKGVSGDVTTMLSPTYMKIYSEINNEDHPPKYGKALAFELNSECFNSNATALPTNVYDLDMKKIESGNNPYAWTQSKTLKNEELQSVANLVVKAWKQDARREKTLLMHDLTRARGSIMKIRCEANITRMEENALVLVMRDISERFRRFEAEKKVISETTARLKDAAANRFTRHEVKNGLLSAIALCDSLQESVNDLERQLLEKDKSKLQETESPSENDGADVKEDASATITDIIGTDYGRRKSSERGLTAPAGESPTQRFLFELDKTLYEILDTILAEAMARDVIHEVYEPNLERVNVPKVLSESMNLSISSNTRFPINASPETLPDFGLDTQLLKYIHRNAISNACKYGKKGGVVKTNVHWDRENGELKMDVINLPGDNHAEILKLGELAKEVVFSPRRRLTIHSTGDENNHVAASHSSGDGAWIMHKCAKTLGGKCEIQFKEDGTIFSFSCPARVYDEAFKTEHSKIKDFELPKNVYAIAIDDSKIQRKLFTLFFKSAGIPEDRIQILGGSAEEINTFCEFATKFVDEHPDDLILMIVDENLDIQEEIVGKKHASVSGSAAVAEMRRRLLPDQERRVLALIRSANDSARDVSIYNSRAHGYLPKSPVKKNQVLGILAPLWLDRFPRFVPQARGWRKKKSVEDVVITIDDLKSLIDDIDNLSVLNEDELGQKWSIIWEKMHALKGDLQIMPEKGNGLDKAIKLISNLRGPEPPENFAGCWDEIRSNLLLF